MSKRPFSIARYTLLPGIVPRLGKLLFTGFAPLTSAMAQAFVALRLLPRNHAYVLPANYGRFSARNVMAEARRHLVIDRDHADQVILYYTLLLGFFLMIAELVAAGLTLAIHHARAAASADVGDTYHDFFVTPQPQTDLAFNILDLMFGFKGIFDSDSIGKATSMQTGLQALFHFYNLGILAVAAIVLLYTVGVVVAETASTGVPFGRRFNGAWAPLRMVFAVGLLCPLTFGMNGGQLLTMYVAKWGSSLATNAWIIFLDNLNGATQMGEASSLVIEPGIPDARGLAEFLFVAKTCAHYQCLMHGTAIQGYVINDKSSCAYLKAPSDCPPQGTQSVANGTASETVASNAANASTSIGGIDCDAVTTKAGDSGGGTGSTGTGSVTTSSVDNFSNAQTYSQHRSIYIRFGDKSSDYKDQKGHVSPICGDLTYEVKDTAQPGADLMQSKWYDLLNQLWTRQDFDTTAQNIAKSNVQNMGKDPDVPIPATGTTQEFLKGINDYMQSYEQDALQQSRKIQISQGTWNEDFTKYGWMGAAIWYNKLAEMNGALMAAVANPPHGGQYTAVMENIAAQRQESNPSGDPMQRYQPTLGGGMAVDFANPDDQFESIAEYKAQKMFQSGYAPTENNGIIDMINAIFGTGNLFSMEQNLKDGINPLMQLVGLGRGLLEASIRNMGVAFGGAILGGIGSIVGNVPASSIGRAITQMSMSIGTIGLAVGIALFYLIPFLPFMYFFFSATTWLKSIFVALTSIPLWAIAHMRIDGEGLPGRSAMDGYLMLLEIFIRPVTMVIGLIGGLAIFAAQAMVLAEIWDLVTVNLTGFDYTNKSITATAATGTNLGTTTGAPVSSMGGLRGVIDQFMMTVLFAIVIYMMALGSFKMTDAIPDAVMRWMSFRGFGSVDPNPAEGVMKKVSEGALLLVDPQRGALVGLLSRNG